MYVAFGLAMCMGIDWAKVASSSVARRGGNAAMPVEGLRLVVVPVKLAVNFVPAFEFGLAVGLETGLEIGLATGLAIGLVPFADGFTVLGAPVELAAAVELLEVLAA